MCLHNPPSKPPQFVTPSQHCTLRLPCPTFYRGCLLLPDNPPPFLPLDLQSPIRENPVCPNCNRRCGRKGCRGMKRAPEFDLRNGDGDGNKEVREVNELPWKGWSEDDLFYECLRVELRKMAPPNGRAVMLFCEESVSKIQVWGTVRHGDRRPKKNKGGKRR